MTTLLSTLKRYSVPHVAVQMQTWERGWARGRGRTRRADRSMWGGRAWGKQRRQDNSPLPYTASVQLHQRNSSLPPCTRYMLMHLSSLQRGCTTPPCTVSAQMRLRDSSPPLCTRHMLMHQSSPSRDCTTPLCMVSARLRQRDSSPPLCTADMKMLLSRRRHCNRRQDRKRSRGRTACGQNQQ